MSSPKIRAEILNTGHDRTKSATIEIEASASAIFSIISNPHRHQDFDGSRTIRSNFSGPKKLFLGAKFGMKMRLGINYQVTNTVVEYEENKVIAWRHLGRWIWRYELIEITASRTRVTETFDARTAPFLAKKWLQFRKAYPWTEITIAKSLVRLKDLAENE